jgi:hypothetical protein
MAANGNGSRTQYRTVKITVEGHKLLHELLDKAARDGWSSLGADRKDKVTIASVVEEALTSLRARKPLPPRK